MSEEEDLRALSLAVAELVGDKGFKMARKCPQGHGLPLIMEDCDVQSMCPACLYAGLVDDYDEMDHRDDEADKHRADPTWHPEWRFQRGDPKNYATDLNLIADAERMFRGGHPNAEVSVDVNTAGVAVSWSGGQMSTGEAFVGATGDTEAVTRCRALIAAALRWGWGRQQR